MPRRISVTLLALLSICLCLAGTARADDLTASAEFSKSVTTVSEPVELLISVTGATQDVPPEVRMDGLDIQFMRTSSSSQTQIQLINSKLSSVSTTTYTYTYAITPKRDGNFTIPALQINAGGGKTVTTQPVTLRVVYPGQPRKAVPIAPTAQNNPVAPPAGSAPQSQATPASQDEPESRQFFAEWVVPVTRAYAGQSIPIEYRLYVDSKVSWNPQHFPAFSSGDGFTAASKFAQPKPGTTVSRGGRSYDLVVFKTAITPVKTGTLTLPATDIDFIAQVQQRIRPPHMSGLPDPFDNAFFNQQFSVRQTVTAHADPINFEVIPLPTAGRPKSFSGAVGQFTLQTKASPVRIHAGDPITVTAEVSGIGNFDQLQPPVIADEPGWKSYPPSSKFKSDDDVGVSGVKTFESALITELPKAALPKIEFSYFDPTREHYVTLTGDRIPISVEGSMAPSPTPALAAAQSTAGTASPTPVARPNDILFIRTDPGRWGVTFESPWRTRHFWLAQLFPFGALLSFCGWQCRQARLGDLRARRTAAFRTAKAEAERLLRQESTLPADFYLAAVRVLQFETAINAIAHKHECDPATVDAETVCTGQSLDPGMATDLRGLFAAHDELRYAGASGQDGAINPERREHVLQILERFEKSHV